MRIRADALAGFLTRMVMESLKAPSEEVSQGHPCKQLIRDGLRDGGFNALVGQWTADSLGYGEYMLDGVTFKMCWTRVTHNSQQVFELYFSQDADRVYPETVRKFREMVDPKAPQAKVYRFP